MVLKMEKYVNASVSRVVDQFPVSRLNRALFSPTVRLADIKGILQHIPASS
jgi:hypothetical protein